MNLPFIYQADGYKTTGCYNTNCPGFIIVTRKPSIGSIFKLSSVYGGDKTVIFTPHVYQVNIYLQYSICMLFNISFGNEEYILYSFYQIFLNKASFQKKKKKILNCFLLCFNIYVGRLYSRLGTESR